jgi:serine/threonine protein kinase
MHKHGVLHRDLKPQNIVLRLNDARTRVDGLYIIDFGISVYKMCSGEKGIEACPRDSGCVLYNRGFVDIRVFTAWYRPPEVMLKDNRYELVVYGFPADVYSLGCIIFEVFSGAAINPVNDEVGLIAQYRKEFGHPAVSAITEPRWDIKKVCYEPGEIMRNAQPKYAKLKACFNGDVTKGFGMIVRRMMHHSPALRLSLEEAAALMDAPDFPTGCATNMVSPENIPEQPETRKDNNRGKIQVTVIPKGDPERTEAEVREWYTGPAKWWESNSGNAERLRETKPDNPDSVHTGGNRDGRLMTAACLACLVALSSMAAMVQ